MDPKRLEEIASFNLAKYVWSVFVCTKISTKQLLSSDVIPSNTSKRTLDIGNLLTKLFPQLPNICEQKVISSITVIDKELTRWEHGGKNQIYRFDDIRWTSYMTIDRIRTKCTTKEFSLDDDKLCQCCELQYVDSYRSILGLADRKKLRTFFGKYLDHAVLYWYWYGRSKIWYFLAHVWKCYPLYERGNPLENIFKVSVLCEYDVAALYYWGKMTKEERSAQRSIIIPWVLSESDYLDFERFTGLLPSITFQYFWLQLTNDERFDVARTYFLDFYRFMIYHEDGLQWIHTFLDTWNPSLSPINYFKVLRISFDTNNPQLFELLWKRKIAHLSAEVVGHLLWTLLLEKDVDLKLSVMIISDYDNDRKLAVLNELDKRIENAKVNYHDRIDRFLDRASLQHLRMIGFPRNPRLNNNRKRHRSSYP